MEWVSLLIVALTVILASMKLALVYWVAKGVGPTSRFSWLKAGGQLGLLLFFLLALWYNVASPFQRYLCEATFCWDDEPLVNFPSYQERILRALPVKELFEWTLGNPWVLWPLFVVDIALFIFVVRRSRALKLESADSTQKQPLWGISWVAVLVIHLLVAVLLLWPYYGSGVYQMSVSEIYSTGVDLNWHPFYNGMTESLYMRALPIVELWVFLSIPLFVVLVWELFAQWRNRSLGATFVRLGLTLFSTVVLFFSILAFDKMMTWIMD